MIDFPDIVGILGWAFYLIIFFVVLKYVFSED